MLLSRIRASRCEVENQYARVVREEGKPQALGLLAEVFELRPHLEWRGLNRETATLAGQSAHG